MAYFSTDDFGLRSPHDSETISAKKRYTSIVPPVVGEPLSHVFVASFALLGSKDATGSIAKHPQGIHKKAVRVNPRLISIFAWQTAVRTESGAFIDRWTQAHRFLRRFRVRISQGCFQ